MTKKISDSSDIDLFRQAVGDVRTIKNDKVLHKPARPKPRPQTHAVDLEGVWQNSNDGDIDPISHEESLNFTAPGIQHSILAKLRKGFFGIQAELDLHGLNSHAAKSQLENFLQASVSQGRRCVHIIHGKGYHSSENQPVLKNHINRWLRQHKFVQAFCSAPPKHGGTGAVYVLLKKSGEFFENFE